MISYFLFIIPLSISFAEVQARKFLQRCLQNFFQAPTGTFFQGLNFSEDLSEFPLKIRLKFLPYFFPGKLPNKKRKSSEEFSRNTFERFFWIYENFSKKKLLQKLIRGFIQKFLQKFFQKFLGYNFLQGLVQNLPPRIFSQFFRNPLEVFWDNLHDVSPKIFQEMYTEASSSNSSKRNLRRRFWQTPKSISQVNLRIPEESPEEISEVTPRKFRSNSGRNLCMHFGRKLLVILSNKSLVKVLEGSQKELLV